MTTDDSITSFRSDSPNRSDNALLVSVVIPSFNQGRFLRETIESCLAQDYRPIELIVQDGASTDTSLDVLRSFTAPELMWYSEPDAGVVDAVNKGLRRAKGAVLSIQSSDDVFVPAAIRAAVHALTRDPELGLVYGDIEYIDAESRVTGTDIQGPFDLAEYLGRFMYVPQPGAFFTRSAMLDAGPWRNEVSYAADADFWLRIAARHKVRKLDRVVARYRYHEAQRDKQREKIAADWVRTIEKFEHEQTLTSRQLRYARMGKHLARYRYASADNWLGRTVAVYGALLANPAAASDSRFPRRDLLPARDPIWRWLSRIKSAIRTRL